MHHSFLSTYKTGITKASLIITALLLISLDSHAQNPKLKPLEFLIGKWEFREFFFEPDSVGIIESGKRHCFYSLDSNYIQCETVAVNKAGRKRTYKFFINYNPSANWFEMLSLYGNWYKRRVDIITFDTTRNVFTLYGSTSENNVERRIWGEWEYKNEKLTWTGRLNTSKDRPDTWRRIYREESWKEK